MKAIILAGGLGTRLSEETTLKPKPMVEIGGFPILWHILKIYSSFGINDFIICCGYKGYQIKEYFANYFMHSSDVRFDISNNEMQILNAHAEPWTVSLIDTGINTMTGGRLKRIRDYVGEDDFCFTYGDGLTNQNILKTIECHKLSGKLATVTAIQPPGRYGALNIDNNLNVKDFTEKPLGDGSWINGGFFVLNPSVFDMINGDDTTWEDEPMKNLVFRKELNAFKHTGFWQSMDTLRDKNYLEDLWKKNAAPWKVWR